MVYSTQFAGAGEQFGIRLVSTLGAPFFASTAALHTVHSSLTKSDHDEASGKHETLMPYVVLAGAMVLAKHAPWCRLKACRFE